MTFDKETTERIEKILDCFSDFRAVSQYLGILSCPAGYYAIQIDPVNDFVSAAETIKSPEQLCSALMDGVCTEMSVTYCPGGEYEKFPQDVHDRMMSDINGYFAPVLQSFPEYASIAKESLEKEFHPIQPA